jgi:hypothetical protein
MKQLAIILILSLMTAVQAQSSDRLQTRISDDNQTLSIKIDGNKQGREIHFQQAFDVSRMNGLQIDLLKYRAFASQGITLPIHEMKYVISAVLGVLMLIALAIAFYILRYQANKGIRSNSGEPWQVA